MIVVMSTHLSRPAGEPPGRKEIHANHGIDF
jgi:hypothetical protein